MQRPRIAHIGPNADRLNPFFRALERRGFAVEAGLSAVGGERLASSGRLHAAMFETEGLEAEPAALAEGLLRADGALTVVVLAAELAPDAAFRLGQTGVAALLAPPGTDDDPDAWAERMSTRAALRIEAAARPPGAADPFDALVGASVEMRRVVERARAIAPRQSTVLIHGQTGTGKELLARAIHRASGRAAGPFVAVNCGAVPAELIESELFGHVRGAFTGAVNQRAGKFELADRGTIFLDEVGETPPAMQAKLLRALQEREFERVGGAETLRVDVRVIAATNRDLGEMVAQGRFREDLFYRLNVVPIEIPRLARRIEDLPAIVERLLDKVCRREGVARKRCPPETLRRLAEHSWPGNVRELENAVENAVALSGDRDVLRPSDFPLPRPVIAAAPALDGALDLPPDGLDYDSVVAGLELRLMRQALERANGNKKRAAELLRLKRTTFNARWKSIESGGREGAPC